MLNRNNRLLIIALDSAEPDRILAWAQEGHLPVIRSLMERGTFGNLTGREMISVHGIWTSFFSGVSIQDHGLYLHRILVPGSYRMERSAKSISTKAPPFWSGLDSSRKALIFDAPDCPVVSNTAGVQIANWGNHPTPPDWSADPVSIKQEMLSLVGNRIPTDEEWGSHRRDVVVLNDILKRVEKKGIFCRHLMKKQNFDLVVVGFGDSHAASHRYRKYQSGDDRELNSAMLKIYQAMDAEIGLLLDQIPEANVFVATNAGISDGYPAGKLVESFCRKLGYHAVNKSYWFRPSSSRLEHGTDWKHTTAFAIPSYYTGYIRLNLKNREPSGVVEPGAEYETILDRLESDFTQLKDEETNEPVIQNITRTATLFDGSAPVRLPDMIVDWRPSQKANRAIVHPKTRLVSRRIGDGRGNFHSRTGWMLGAGPFIKNSGFAGDFSVLEFVPLFQNLLRMGNQQTPSDPIKTHFLGV